MDKKGLNPNSTSDIASVEPSDFVIYLKSIEEYNDDLSRKIKAMVQILSISFYDQLNFPYKNQTWNPNTGPPHNDMTK
eukprot:10756733-Ditylum_brightwellii.AAC.1